MKIHSQEEVRYTLFNNAEEIWFWFCRSQKARQELSRFEKNSYSPIRPCSPDDILQIVLQLNLAGILQKRHINTLTKYGNLYYIPDYRIKEESLHALWWDDAIDKLTVIFKKKGFIYEANSK